MTHDELIELVDLEAAKITEHVDYVQILVGFKEGDNCYTYESGIGNIYSRTGHAQSWLNIQYEFDRGRARKMQEGEK